MNPFKLILPVLWIVLAILLFFAAAWFVVFVQLLRGGFRQ